jgi:hypothetical protein
MNATINTDRMVITNPVPLLDTMAQGLATFLSRFSSVVDAGAFWHQGGSSFWDAWKEGRGTVTMRLGRLELVVDRRS